MTAKKTPIKAFYVYGWEDEVELCESDCRTEAEAVSEGSEALLDNGNDDLSMIVYKLVPVKKITIPEVKVVVTNIKD